MLLVVEDDDDGVEYTAVEGGVVNGDKAPVLWVVEGAVVLKAVVIVGLGVDDAVLAEVFKVV